MKVVVVGDAMVGKTTLIERLKLGVFKPDNLPTIGAGFYKLDLHENRIQVWDISGNEKYKALLPIYFYGGTPDFTLFVFDISKKESIEKAKQIYKEFKDKTKKSIFVGTKCDLSAEIYDFEVEYEKYTYIKVSSKTGEGFDKLRHSLKG